MSYQQETTAPSTMYAPEAIDLLFRAAQYASAMRLTESPEEPDPEESEDEQ